jgi:hypothetical protein
MRMKGGFAGFRRGGFFFSFSAKFLDLKKHQQRYVSMLAYPSTDLTSYHCIIKSSYFLTCNQR